MDKLGHYTLMKNIARQGYLETGDKEFLLDMFLYAQMIEIEKERQADNGKTVVAIMFAFLFVISLIGIFIGG